MSAAIAHQRDIILSQKVNLSLFTSPVCAFTAPKLIQAALTYLTWEAEGEFGAGRRYVFRCPFRRHAGGACWLNGVIVAHHKCDARGREERGLLLPGEQSASFQNHSLL